MCRAFGPADTHKVEDIPAPEMTTDGIRIRVRAAGLSFANLLVIEGKHQNKPALPFTPGTEIAGQVLEVAPGAGHMIKPGDRVCAGIPSGGFAEEVVATPGNVFPIPDELEFTAATLFPTIYSAAYAALAWRAALQPDEVLLVHAAAGASGLAAVEIGKALGAKVIATAGSPEKCAVASSHGADHTIDYRAREFRTKVLDLTDGRGADVIFDPVGGEIFQASLRCIAPLGRIIPIGFASGRIPQIPANIVLVKNVTVIGIYWGYYLGWGKSQANAAVRAKVRDLFKDLFALAKRRALNPVVDSTLQLDEFAAGLKRIARRSVIGKVVIIP